MHDSGGLAPVRRSRADQSGPRDGCLPHPVVEDGERVPRQRERLLHLPAGLQGRVSICLHAELADPRRFRDRDVERTHPAPVFHLQNASEWLLHVQLGVPEAELDSG